MRKLKKIFCVFILTAISASCGSQTAFDATLKSIYKNTVPQIQAKMLFADISTDTSLVLLDAREQKEYAISHIRNAVFAGYENFDTSFFFSIPKQSKIIIYCSVGYRSERIGERFLQRGFSNVFNLYGGIFNWVNEGHEVVDDNQKPTNRIHAYSNSWGKFLKTGEKVFDY